MFKKTVVHFLSVGNHEISGPESGRFVPTDVSYLKLR